MLDTALRRELVGSLLPGAVVLDSALSAHRQCDRVFNLEIPLIQPTIRHLTLVLTNDDENV
jgi:hypothetical protein